MDVVMLTKCARLAVERHSVSWTRLSFEKKHEIIQELESQLPKPAPVRVTIPERGADGNSPVFPAVLVCRSVTRRRRRRRRLGLRELRPS
jgi:hypothetical protein